MQKMSVMEEANVIYTQEDKKSFRNCTWRLLGSKNVEISFIYTYA